MAGSGLGTSGLPILRDVGGQQSRNVTSEWKGRWWHRAECRFFAPLTASPSSRQDGESGGRLVVKEIRCGYLLRIT